MIAAVVLMPDAEGLAALQAARVNRLAIRGDRNLVISSQLPPFLKRHLQTLPDAVAVQE